MLLCYCRFSENPHNFLSLEISLPIRHRDHGLRPWHCWCQEKNWAECSAPRWKEKQHKRFLVVKNCAETFWWLEDPTRPFDDGFQTLEFAEMLKSHEIPRHFMFDFSGWWTPVFSIVFRRAPTSPTLCPDTRGCEAGPGIVKTLPIQVVCVLIPPSTNNLLPNHLGPPLKMCCNFPQNPLKKSFWGFAKCVNFDPPNN